MDTEKITINLGVVELGKIDLLVEKGIFSNRTDFIRSAVRGSLAHYDNDIRDYMKPHFENTDKKGREWRWNLGIEAFSRKYFLELQESGKKLSMTTVGMLIIGKDVTPELFRATVERVKVYGKLAASDEIKQIIKEMNERG